MTESSMTLSFSREFAQQYGMIAALVYQELYRKYFYWSEQGQLVDGFFWCDQKTIADWLLISTKTLGRAVNTLKDEGLIETETHYKPGSSETTTWWKVTKWDSSMGQNVQSCESGQNVASYIKADTVADTESVSGIVTVIERKKKGESWVDGRRIYTTEEEAEKIESCSRGEYPDFFYWQSRKLVGDESKKKRKCNMPATLLKLEYENPEPTVEVNGKKVKVSYKERLY